MRSRKCHKNSTILLGNFIYYTARVGNRCIRDVDLNKKYHFDFDGNKCRLRELSVLLLDSSLHSIKFEKNYLLDCEKYFLMHACKTVISYVGKYQGWPRCWTNTISTNLFPAVVRQMILLVLLLILSGMINQKL